MKGALLMHFAACRGNRFTEGRKKICTEGNKVNKGKNILLRLRVAQGTFLPESRLTPRFEAPIPTKDRNNCDRRGGLDNGDLEFSERHFCFLRFLVFKVCSSLPCVNRVLAGWIAYVGKAEMERNRLETRVTRICRGRVAPDCK